MARNDNLHSIVDIRLQPPGPPPKDGVRFAIIVWSLFIASQPADAAAPSFNVFGAFFPAWLAFGLVGIVVALLCRAAFVLVGLDQILRLRLFAYLGIGITSGAVGWLVSYGPMP